MARHAEEKEQIYSLPKSIFNLIDKALGPEEGPYALMALVRLYFEGVEPDLDDYTEMAQVVLESVIGRVRASRAMSLSKAEKRRKGKGNEKRVEMQEATGDLAADRIDSKVGEEIGEDLRKDFIDEVRTEEEGEGDKRGRRTEPLSRARVSAARLPAGDDEIRDYVAQFAAAKGLEGIDTDALAEKLIAHYSAIGWVDGNGNEIVDWKAMARKWVLTEADGEQRRRKPKGARSRRGNGENGGPRKGNGGAAAPDAGWSDVGSLIAAGLAEPGAALGKGRRGEAHG